MYRTRFRHAEIDANALIGEGVIFESKTVEIGPGVQAKNTVFADNARVFGGSFSGHPDRPSRVAGQTCVAGDPFVVSSILCCDAIYGRPVILGSGVIGRAKVYGQACLSNVIVNDHARVYGKAILDGSSETFTVGGQARVCAGTWKRAPRCVDLGFCVLTEGPEGLAMIDCVLRPYEDWFRIGPRWGRQKMGITASQVREIWRVFEDWSGQSHGESPVF